MQKRTYPGTLSYRFESLHELGQFIRDTPRTWSENYATNAPASRHWDLNAGYDNAVRMAVEGWNEGAERTQEALKVFLPTTIEPENVTDFYGYRPHVARYCAGAPDCMIRKTYAGETGAGRVVTIAVNIAASAYQSAEHLANFGVAVAQFVAQLEAQGTRVELLGAEVVIMHGKRLSLCWTIKNADQPLDLSVVAFAIGHPAMLRRIVLAFEERCDYPTCYSYGTPTALKAHDIINAPDGLLILNGMNYADRHARTPQEGLAYVEKTINQLLGDQG